MINPSTKQSFLKRKNFQNTTFTRMSNKLKNELADIIFRVYVLSSNQQEKFSKKIRLPERVFELISKIPGTGLSMLNQKEKASK